MATIPCTHSFPALKNVPKRWTLLSLTHTRYPVWVRRRPTKWKWRPCPQVVPSQHWRSLCLCCRSAACHLYTYTLSCLSGVICTLIPNCLTALVVRHSTMAINLWAAGIMVPALGRSPWTPGWLYPWLQEEANDFKNIPISLVSTTCKVKFDREETALGRAPAFLLQHSSDNVCARMETQVIFRLPVPVISGTILGK